MIYGMEAYMVDEKLDYIMNPSDTILNKSSFCVFDFETTGLSARYDKIIEFGAVKVKDGMVVDCGGIITNVHKIFTKQTNKPMAIVTIEDIYGEFDAMIFNKLYETLEETLENDKIVHINGRVSIRVGDSPIIIVSKLDYLSESDENLTANQNDKQEKKVFGETAEIKVETKKIYMRFDLSSKVLVDQVLEILQCYSGNSPALVQYEGKLYPLNIFAEPSNSLIAELGGLIGYENIKIK